MVQGCEATNKAWDILKVSIEDTSNVKRTWIDILASQFVILSMGEDEMIENFRNKLSSIANEDQVLGKKYKDNKLVKKLLISLP